MQKAITTIFLLTAFLALPFFANAIDYIFTGTGNWTNAARWNCNCVPPNPLPLGDVVSIEGNCTVNDVRNINSGIVINSGALNVATGADLNILSGAILFMNGGAFNVSGGTSRVAASATLTMNSVSSDVNLGGGSLNILGTFNANAGNLNINNAVLSISGVLNLGALCLPTVSGGGNLEVQAGGTVNVNGSNALTVNAGSGLVVLAGGVLQFGAAGVLNNNGFFNLFGTLNVGSGATMNLNSGSLSFVNNGGDLNVQGGGVLNNNTGSSVTMNSGGMITIQNGGTRNGAGGFLISAGAELILNNNPAALPSAGFTWAGVITVGSTGELPLASGLIVPAGATFNIGGTVNAFATLSNNGTLNINSGGTVNANAQFFNFSTLNLNAAGNLVLGGNPASLPSGTFNWNSGGKVSVGSGGLLNLPTSFTLPAGRTLEVQAGGELKLNSGALNLNGTLLNEGTITNNATIHNSSTGSFSNPGGIYQGTGLWTFGFAPNGGTISPGNSAGCLSFDGAVSLNSTTLAIELGGSSACALHDRLTIDNFDVTASLNTTGGTVEVSFINGFVPTAGQTFNIAFANFLTGSLPNLLMPPGFDGSLSFHNGIFLRLTISSILPVELVDFQAVVKGEKVRLQWETASEQNNEGFFVERSTDGRDWLDLGFVAGKGTTTAANSYVFYDEKPLADALQNFEDRDIYYRLRQVDFDGKAALSDVVSVEVKAALQPPFQAYPNPVTDGELTVFLPMDIESEITAAIFDQAGRFVRSMPVRSGANTLNLQGLGAGVYTLKMGYFRERILIRP